MRTSKIPSEPDAVRAPLAAQPSQIVGIVAVALVRLHVSLHDLPRYQPPYGGTRRVSSSSNAPCHRLPYR
ncbi:MAG: hypothetical protein ABJA60_08585 [Nitrosospira sp.]